MVSFLRWCRSILFGVLNGVAKFAVFLILLFLVLIVIALFQGDGLPGNMVLALDLRSSISDSSNADFDFGSRPVTVMDIVLGLDAAERDGRVKGAYLRLGSGSLSVAEAEEIGAAIAKFRKAGKFAIVHAQGFESAGLGDYLAAASADQIWMQPKSPFTTAGLGGSEFFLRGLLDKIEANPQIVKRADYKSAADMFMEKTMTPADREQLTRMLQTAYDAAASGAAHDRHLSKDQVVAAFEASPQFTETALAAHLIDRVGYDDEAQGAALARAGTGAKLVKMSDWVKARHNQGEPGSGARIALIEASGEIQDGTSGGGSLFGGSGGIYGDDLAKAIRMAAADNDVKAIVLRVDSPGGSVAASDQILDAVKKAQIKGKPVVVSMGSVAASGGYYISLSANRIVAEPATITGSIGVLTGKVSVDRSLAAIGISAESVNVGRNALYNSEFQPYTPDQLAALNREADLIYADFTGKVAKGRKLPLDKVQDIAKGRVWSGVDARSNGLVDELGNFWAAADAAKKLAGISTSEQVAFRSYPRKKGFFQALGDLFSGGDFAEARAVRTFFHLMDAAPVKALDRAVTSLPRGGVEMRATNLPY